MINYVIAAWSGWRRYEVPGYTADRTYYLRHHLQSMHDLAHFGLTRITVVVPYDPSEPKNYTEYINSLPKTWAGVPLVVFRRENVGLSYGSLSDAYGRSRDDGFKAYFFMEDDYQLMLDRSEEPYYATLTGKVGYVAGVAGAGHGRVANGLLSAEALRAVWDKYGKLPHFWEDASKHCWPENYGLNEIHGQCQLGFALSDTGWEIADVLQSYSVLYVDARTLETTTYGHGPVIMGPIW